MIRRLLPLSVLILAACGSQPPRPVEDRGSSGPATAKPAAKTPATPNVTLKKGGGFYKDDGPGEITLSAEEMEAIPDAVPKAEPLHRFANRPYSVLGKDYVPIQHLGIYKAKGTASWYGRKFHGQKTSSGEAYDMFGMTAAHTLLPIPSYVRVSNPATGKAVVLRVNDRGPFHADRIIDLSYTAAWKLGLVGNGSGTVVVESLLPGEALPPPVED
ncbi:MAG: septal ring lytic transglycosylase RlpA family protein, partial [Rhodocyclaceae bacterium]|nr:septal ring lytic transglycosylase RlpA family protein [Rhodocyclaceae bacterium]